MNMSRSMMLREQQRQRERALALRASQGHKPGDLVGVTKQHLTNAGLGVDQKPSEYHCAYDCTVCNQRFVWDIRQPLTKCPLCHAGPKQKPNKLPKKRVTHRQARKAKAKAKAKAKLNTQENDMNELNETKEQEEARTEAARAAGTLIEASVIIRTGGDDPTPARGDDVKPDAVAPEFFYHELAELPETDCGCYDCEPKPPEAA